MQISTNPDGRPIQTTGPVLVIGSGLLGGSAALALKAAGVEVFLQDISPVSLALARDIGAGEEYAPSGPQPALVIVAVPPDVTADCVVKALKTHPNAVVTDVASVKSIILEEVEAAGVDASRYVPSHPMAGRERSGVAAADRDLFVGRPWAVIHHPTCSPQARVVVRNLAVDLGATVLEMNAQEHDRGVAIVSHVPQLVSSLLASRLRDATEDELSLVGQGLRDTTRIAASDPRLWTSIVSGNCGPVVDVLREYQRELDNLVSGLESGAAAGFGATGSVAAINTAISQGNEGVSRIPGKHGGVQRRWAIVEVLIPDKPGELGRLFTELGAAGINIEDLTMDHSAHQRVGLAQIFVNPTVAKEAEKELEMRGWRIVNQ
ncbi:prephenate dehydrogenase [uncultured Actinomyces sp.]|uniref:prephenate dehydrogenase n=1 Tax=uncultured Actinomyces sp. TaxID=249061 RepID=UPI00288A8C3F|nr:prephenate dehydrogenase [uncultured Actinomyces sp.]